VPPTPQRDLASLYPLLSFSALCVFWLLVPFLTVSRGAPHYNFGGALAGVVLSFVGIWAFFSCPLRHWFAKILSLLCLVAVLFWGISAVGSFFIHVLGFDAA
jgi:hypothetical protein